MNKSRSIKKEYRWSTIGLIIIILLIVFTTELFIPKTKLKYSVEVQQIASARYFYGYKNCPNEIELDKIKSAYLSSIPEKEVNKRVWVLKHFNSVYIETCVKDS